MSKLMIWIVVLAVVAIGGAFMELTPPLSWVWGAALVVLTIVATLAWSSHTLAGNDPGKFARFVARYVPKDEVMRLLNPDSDWFERFQQVLRNELLKKQ